VDSPPIDDETKHWITDVYLDKVYELNNKLHLLFSKTSKRDFPVNIHNALIQLEKASHNLAYPRKPVLPDNRDLGDYQRNLGVFPLEVTNKLDDFIGEIEWSLLELRKNLSLSDWKEISKIKPIEFTNLPRRKYITAREEISKAKDILSKNPEDVMMHLRPAIVLSLKQRFGFKIIHPMKAFIEDAKRYDLPLPSYDLIYHYFNEGSQRSHQGKMHMSFEAQEAIRTVSNFIDELETLEVSKEKIDDFIRKSNAVK
jgi:hypothetical protein